MAINDGLIKELQHEAANTRKILERVPMDKATWKPHDKSTTLASLATHVARLPLWVERVMTKDGFDAAAPGAFPKQEQPKTSKELLDTLDNSVAAATKSLQAASDEDLMKPWSFSMGEHKVFTLPRVAALRTMGLSHLYHHRGQLSVYLRLLDVPVPGMYGPSADEQR